MDRLALVSKIMLDRRFLELRQENESLKLELFWKTHSEDMLRELMKEANNYGMDPPKCMCVACGMAGRIDADEEMGQPAVCKFKPWFERHLATCGLTVVAGVSSDRQIVRFLQPDRLVYDVDAHFHMPGRDDWFFWTYGLRLWNAKSANDPEIMKLTRLFEILRTEAEVD